MEYRRYNINHSYYVYRVSYGDGCHNYVDSFRIGLNAIFTSITINEFELGTTGGPFISYQWILDGAIIPGATDSIYYIRSNGDHRVIVINEYSCIDTAEMYPVTNYGDAGTEDIAAVVNQIQVYPNPTVDMMYIKSMDRLNITLTDISGKVIHKFRDTHNISLKELPPGIYLLRITDYNGAGLKVIKAVKQAE